MNKYFKITHYFTIFRIQIDNPLLNLIRLLWNYSTAVACFPHFPYQQKGSNKNTDYEKERLFTVVLARCLYSY
mgnify:CR=1 FL=1